MANKTSYLGLGLPAQRDQNWGQELNRNFDTLDMAYGTLQGDMESLERASREDGFFNFIEGQEYILLGSAVQGELGKNNNTPLFSNVVNTSDTLKGSQFFLAGSVEQSTDLSLITFKVKKVYCTDTNLNLPMRLGETLTYTFFFNPVKRDYSADTNRMEKYTVKVEYPSEITKTPVYQLPNNTAFYVAVPARGYENEITSTLYSKSAIYYERQIVVKYTNVGNTVFEGLNNVTSGVYVPQKDIHSNAITFIRRPITDTAQRMRSYIDPWYVNGEYFDIAGLGRMDEYGKWSLFNIQTYVGKIPYSAAPVNSASDYSQFMVQFYSYNGAQNVTGVVVDYVIVPSTKEDDDSSIYVYGVTEDQIKQLKCRVLVLKDTNFIEEKEVGELKAALKNYVDEQIKKHVTDVINTDT